MVKFSYTILYVSDVEKTIQFYENAFGLQRKFITPDNSYGELLTAETTLSFANIDFVSTNLKNGFIKSNQKDKPFGIEVGFSTDNVQQVVDSAVSAGATIYELPTAKPWGQIVAYIRDINGFLIEICTPMG